MTSMMACWGVDDGADDQFAAGGHRLYDVEYEVEHRPFDQARVDVDGQRLREFAQAKLDVSELHSSETGGAESGAASARKASQDVAPCSGSDSANAPCAGACDPVQDDATQCEEVEMGDTGLEPVTPSVSCWCASQLRQSPFGSAMLSAVARSGKPAAVWG